ncbi:Zinc finger protein 36, C3H1 type-like 1 [Trichinella zimbabwensis]|uniref:Zinc finger protein 36, C3H1 type-like 1 n=1 Tax=Trichinella zimbabwensis TaxID=268475 RepID=A0A0V1GYH1_9BILA|nr:Zinc finger protein 36, C3H1 type-like 1 [Trichinella zimbabwensis]
MAACLVDVASEKRVDEEHDNNNNNNNNKKPNLALYKTRMCRYFVNGPGCRFGSSCFFAHNLVELRPSMYRNFLYKTEPCRNLRTWGHCKYGPRCLYLHGDERFLIYARTPPSSLASVQPIWPGTSPLPLFGSSAPSARLSTELPIPLDSGEPFDIQFDKFVEQLLFEINDNNDDDYGDDDEEEEEEKRKPTDDHDHCQISVVNQQIIN